MVADTRRCNFGHIHGSGHVYTVMDGQCRSSKPLGLKVYEGT